MQEIPPKTVSNGVTENSLKQEITNLNKNLSILTRANRKRNVILRGLINGVFTAIGATLGFAIFLSMFARVIQGAENVPLLQRVIERLNLESVIERYLNEQNNSNVLPTNTPVPVPTNTPVPLHTNTPVPSNTPTPEVTETEIFELEL